MMEHSSFMVIFFLLSLLFSANGQNDASQRGKRPLAPALMVFGDSIVDAGNNNHLITEARSNHPPYGQDFSQHTPTGRFSNGRTPSDLIAESLGLKQALPAYYDPNMTPKDLLTGATFASGGAGYDNLTAQLVLVFTLWDQLDMFKEYIEKLKVIAGEDEVVDIISDSIYISEIGSNDILNTYYGTPFRRKQYDISSYIDLLGHSAYNFFQALYGLGARKIGVVGLPPLGCLPSQRTLGGGINRDCVESYNQAAKMTNSKLSQIVGMLATELPDAKIIYIDIYNTFYDIIQRPSSYGFEVSNKGCCGTGLFEVTSSCNPSSILCEDPSKYFFWDSYHPTEAGYKAILGPAIRDGLPRLM